MVFKNKIKMQEAKQVSRRCEKIDVNIVCLNCAYGWNTTSKLKRLSCPNCGYTNKNPHTKGD
jgi:ribosomal protein S27AE